MICRQMTDIGQDYLDTVRYVYTLYIHECTNLMYISTDRTCYLSVVASVDRYFSFGHFTSARH